MTSHEGQSDGGQDPTIEIVDAETDTTWQFERSFLESNWTCIWGAGCKGILSEEAESLNQGCCSLGAELDPDEARNLSALAATLDPARFQHSSMADAGIFADDASDQHGWRTRVVDDACIFLNRPGFTGGEGCALHLEALASDESPLEWKPSVCWQLPVHVDWRPTANGGEQAQMRRWQRADWGQHGDTMAWVCTEQPEAYVGHHRVIDSLGEEIEHIVGTPVFVELKKRLGSDPNL
ncbi:MAG: hypothetical protein ACI8TP_003762 [Acidimicrobiales bacterium]|jgi:hypothetical protein